MKISQISRHRALAAGVAAAIASTATPSLYADLALEEIVVTAQKREENVLEVPVAITVVGADQLADQKVYGIADLARTTPSLEMVQAFGGPGGGGQVRGVGTQSFTRSAEGAVGIVVDGVPQGNVPINAVFDLQRVEVLKGPQGTLFGLTASAGVINMTTVAPSTEAVEGYIKADYSPGSGASEFGQKTVRGALNLPLTGKSALRIAANYDEVEGVQYDAATGEDYVSEENSIRARYLLEATDSVTINLTADYSKRDSNFASPTFTYVDVEAGSDLANQLATCGITASYDNNARCNTLAVASDGSANESETTNYGFSGQLDVDLQAGTLTSITGYRKQETGPDDFDIMANAGDFLQIFQVDNVTEGKQFTQEIRFTSNTDGAFEYTVGGFYSKYEGSSGYEGDEGGFYVGSFMLAPFFIPFVHESLATETENEAYALFGQGTYHINENLSVLAGLRYTHQELTDTSYDVLAESPDDADSPTEKEDNVSGKIGVQYTIDSDIMLFATYTRGYKGPQVQAAQSGDPRIYVKPEIPDAYELGAKGIVGEGLGYELSLFYTDVQDYQGQRCRINAVGALACVGESIPSVTTKGFEINLFGSPIENLKLNAGYIYNIAEYPGDWTGFNPEDLRDPTPLDPTIGTTDLGGEQLVGVPKNKLVLNGQYTIPFNTMNLVVGGDAVYKSDIRLGPSSDDRFVYDSDWTLSARIGLEDREGRWNVQLFARNITENREPATLFGGPSFHGPDATSNGYVNGISGWTTKASLKQVGLSTEYRF